MPRYHTRSLSMTPACDKSLAIDSRVIATGLLCSMIALIGTGDSGTVLTGFRESPATSMGLDNHLTSSLSGFNDSEMVLTLGLPVTHSWIYTRDTDRSAIPHLYIRKIK